MPKKNVSSTKSRMRRPSRRVQSALGNRLEDIAGYLYLVSQLPSGYLKESQSQHGQDALVLKLLGHRYGLGFFVEFGAIDGIHNSNTLFLERELGWSGIVSEPSRRWHNALRKNRTCRVDERCVFGRSGMTLPFGDTGKWKGGNTLLEFRDAGERLREFSDVYDVDTVSLVDLLDQGAAPSHIDFISIDTEGSEYEILDPFDFTKYKFSLLLVEHNFDELKRKNIRTLLTLAGYFHLPINDSIAGFDDWYGDEKTYRAFLEVCPKG